MLELIEISNDELLEIDGGGWLSRIGGVLRLYNIRRWIGAGWCRCCKWRGRGKGISCYPLVLAERHMP